MADELDVIERNVALALDRLSRLVDFEFGLDRRSVEWVDGFIERQRERSDLDAGSADGLIGVLGSYLGAALVANTDGEWDRDEQYGWCVRFPNGDAAYPFGKVHKQWAEGGEAGESILSFYDIAVDVVATGRLHGDGDG